MGLFDFFKRRSHSERAIPDPDSAEFEKQVAGSELPGSTGAAGVEPDKWQSVDVQHAGTEGNVLDLRGSGAREDVIAALKRHGIDPDQHGQQVNTADIPELQQEIVEILKKRGVNLPGS